MEKILTRYAPPPIPTRDLDWDAVSEDYEPGDPIGYGPTEESAIADLKAQMEARD